MERSANSRMMLKATRSSVNPPKIRTFPYNNNDYNPPKRSSKRRNDDQIIAGGKRPVIAFETQNVMNNSSGNKYSANTRLQRYRKTLEAKQNQVVKVHTLQSPSKDANRVKEHNQVDEGVKEASSTKWMLGLRNSRYETANKGNALFENIQMDTVNQSISSEENCVEMDWSPINEQDLLTDIQEIRGHCTEILNHKASLEYVSDKIPCNNSVFKDTFIIVDTNVFLSHLSVVNELMEAKLNGVDKPFILVPWVTIQELDYMKDGRGCKPALQKNAQKAVNFINKSLLLRDSNLKGQSVIDASEHRLESNNLDDGILACCMQVVERGNRAILLSNDQNLRNKALVHSISAYAAGEIFRELKIAHPSKEANEKERISMKADDVKSHLTTLFNMIIHAEALSVYGEYYYKMGVLKDAPWNLQECLHKFEKLWIAVFSEKLPKQFLKCVQDFRKVLCRCKSVTSEGDFQMFVHHSLDICMYLKNSMKDYSESTKQCMDNIVKLTK